MGERPPSTLEGPRCGASNGRVRFGTFEVDLRARELRKSGLKIKLHHQPFQVLVLLARRNTGKTVGLRNGCGFRTRAQQSNE